MQNLYTHTGMLIGILLFISVTLPAQNYFQNKDQASVADLFIAPDSFRSLIFDRNLLAQILEDAPQEEEISVKNSEVRLSFPLPDGGTAEFQIIEYNMLEPDLAAAFPHIKTYRGVSEKNPLHTVRFDMTDHGMRAVLHLTNERVYIEPAQLGNQTDYISFYAKDLSSDEIRHCRTQRLPTPEAAARSVPSRLRCRLPWPAARPCHSVRSSNGRRRSPASRPARGENSRSPARPAAGPGPCARR